MKKINSYTTIFIFAVLLSIITCGKEDTLKIEKEAIIGKWVQINLNCTNCDTLLFYENGFLKSNKENYNYAYELISDSLLKIERGNSFENYAYQFSKAKDSLIIYSYIIDLTGIEDLDIELKKID